MATRQRGKLERIGIDALGIVCLLGALTFGWIPGPGGLPLLFAGLGLLAINHEWARRWLHKLRTSGAKLSEHLFPDHTVAKLVYDLLSVIAFVGAIYLFQHFTRNLVRSMAIVLLMCALVIFFLNRHRLEHLQVWVKRVARR